MFTIYLGLWFDGIRLVKSLWMMRCRNREKHNRTQKTIEAHECDRGKVMRIIKQKHFDMQINCNRMRSRRRNSNSQYKKKKIGCSVMLQACSKWIRRISSVFERLIQSSLSSILCFGLTRSNEERVLEKASLSGTFAPTSNDNPWNQCLGVRP